MSLIIGFSFQTLCPFSGADGVSLKRAARQFLSRWWGLPVRARPTLPCASWAGWTRADAGFGNALLT